MPSSGYSAWSVIAGEQPTTAKWNILGTNDASFNNGNGFEDGIIIGRHIATTAISLGYAASSSTNQGTITTEVDITGVSVAVTVPAGGRRCQIVVTLQAFGGAGEIGSVKIKEGATLLKEGRFAVNATTSVQCQLSYSAVLTAGAHTYKATYARQSGTNNHLIENSVAPADIDVRAM